MSHGEIKQCGIETRAKSTNGFHFLLLKLNTTVELAGSTRQRIDPLLEETPALQERVAPARARDSGNTMLSKEFPAVCT